MTSNVAISVVIPVYNGAAYIERTVTSLLSQTFRDFEVICVDDGSTDDSLEILRRLEQSGERLRVFTKPNGGDATQAIIYGVDRALGRYFMYSSQDDLFSTDLLEKSYRRAQETGADAIVPDMKYYVESAGGMDGSDGISGMRGDRSRVLTGREAFVASIDWSIHGFVLWNIDIVRQVGFETYGLSSDEYTTRMFFFACKKVVFSDGIFYYRQDNPGAITKKWNINQLDYVLTCQKLGSFAKQHGFSADEISRIDAVLLGQLIRIQVMFNNNRNRLTNDAKELFQGRMKQAYEASRPGIRLLKTATARASIRKTLCSNYWLFNIYCKILQVRY